MFHRRFRLPYGVLWGLMGLAGFFPLALALQQSPLAVEVPNHVRQGETLFVRIKEAIDGRCHLSEKSVPLLAQPDGSRLALVPVSVFQKPGAYPLKILDAQGQTVYEQSVQVHNAHLPIQNIRVGKATAGLQPLPGEMEAIGALKTAFSPTRHWEMPFLSPTPDCQNSPFGVLRYHNGKPTGDYHKGVDLKSPAGRPIRATAAGRVSIAKMYRLHGGTVGLDHGHGVSSIYIHLSKIAVTEGAQVKKGQTVGYVGSTGFATGPHLHWGLYVNGLPVNPNQWLPAVPRC